MGGWYDSGRPPLGNGSGLSEEGSAFVNRRSVDGGHDEFLHCAQSKSIFTMSSHAYRAREIVSTDIRSGRARLP